MKQQIVYSFLCEPFLLKHNELKALYFYVSIILAFSQNNMSLKVNRNLHTLFLCSFSFWNIKKGNILLFFKPAYEITNNHISLIKTLFLLGWSGRKFGGQIFRVLDLHEINAYGVIIVILRRIQVFNYVLLSCFNVIMLF